MGADGRVERIGEGARQRRRVKEVAEVVVGRQPSGTPPHPTPLQPSPRHPINPIPSHQIQANAAKAQNASDREDIDKLRLQKRQHKDFTRQLVDRLSYLEKEVRLLTLTILPHPTPH